MKRLISVIIVLLGLSLLFDSRILNFIIHYRISYLNYIFIFLTDFGPYIIFLFSTFILLYKKKLKLIPLLWLSFIIVFLLIELLIRYKGEKAIAACLLGNELPAE